MKPDATAPFAHPLVVRVTGDSDLPLAVLGALPDDPDFRRRQAEPGVDAGVEVIEPGVHAARLSAAGCRPLVHGALLLAAGSQAVWPGVPGGG
jgi:hypothetical protein